MAGQEIDHYNCSVCSCEFTDDEGGIDGYFGILPVHFCPTCFSSMCDMAAQYLDIGEDGESNPDHEALIQHLRGYRDIVINAAHGGFGLSINAQLAWLEQSGTQYTTESRNDRHSDQRWGPHILVNNQHWYDHMIARDDTILVQIVKEMGCDSWGEHAKLKVVRIPADVDWEINEYDGQEWVAECHRTWK